jgi:hypothetical protein
MTIAPQRGDDGRMLAVLTSPDICDISIGVRV